MIMEFNRLVQYDKKKKGKKYKNDVDIFLKKASAFFDIYQHDPKQFFDTEKKQMLKMTEPDFQFYEDQKTTRVQYCTLKQIPSSSVVSSVVKWLKHWACDQHGLGSKPTNAILCVLGKDTLRHIFLLGGPGKQF